MKLLALFGVISSFVVCFAAFSPEHSQLILAAQPAEDSPKAQITTVLTEQQSAWNRGDLDAFMKGYWDSPDVTFAGTSGITRGWQPVLDRYRKNYPDQKAMGHLDFSELEVRPLGKDAALVLGRWHLQDDSHELGGIFTLVFQRFPEGWRIIHDHTSRSS
jgi:L-asparaginase / beta-aspartyl-peptidase